MKISDLPTGKQKPALSFPHFPTTWQAVLWRNWGVVPIERIAAALSCQPQELLQAGEALGLEKDESHCHLWLKRGYQTIIRQNWHLLSYEQLLTILDWTPDKLEYILREDDFLWTKLGNLKPELTPPKYAGLTAAQAAQTALLKQWHDECKAKLPPLLEHPFAFLTKPLAAETRPRKAMVCADLFLFSFIGDPADGSVMQTPTRISCWLTMRPTASTPPGCRQFFIPGYPGLETANIRKIAKSALLICGYWHNA